MSQGVYEPAMFPLVQPVDGGKRELRGRCSVSCHGFRASDIVHHPCWKSQVVRVAFDFACMAGQCGDQVAQVVCSDFNQQIGFLHWSPILGFDDETLKRRWHCPERIHDQEVGATVGGVAIQFVW